MSEPPVRFDPDSVRERWDAAAEAYAAGQAAGRDHYRYAFFGPAQVEACGDVKGLRLLDVGCGSGYFSREMAARGARVTGIDLSPRMIELATRAETRSPLGIEYRVMDAAHASSGFAPSSFDIATSCLALQDMPGAARVLAAVASVLRPGARFVASIAHPCTDTPHRVWARDDEGRKLWLCIDRYFERGPIAYTWLRWGAEFTTAAMHATLGDWFQWILAAGLRIRGLREPSPTAQALRDHPDLEDATRVPYFLIFDLVRDP